MKTSDKGKLVITTDQNGNPQVLFEPVDGTVWLSKSELAELFGVYQQKINACLDSIFKTKVFRPEDVSKYDLIVRGNTVRYDMQSFRLEVIITLAFRLHSLNAEILRKWVVSRILEFGLANFSFLDIQNYSLN
ncbi:MAG: hypothetical protein ACLTWE_01875 [Dysgonomonas mossii]|uniref:hypothetical protein n=1 Tax=Dysgonomonas mossii TaxID=163665 RepID=UPI003994100C